MKKKKANKDKPISVLRGTLLLIGIIILSVLIYKFNYSLGTIFWLGLGGFVIYALIKLRKRKSNSFFIKNKIWIILAISFVCLLDTITTYLFVRKDLSNEMNVIQRLLIHLFGIYFGLGIMFLLSIFVLIFLISKLPKKISKNIFIIAIILKLFVSYTNYFY